MSIHLEYTFQQTTKPEYQNLIRHADGIFLFISHEKLFITIYDNRYRLQNFNHYLSKYQQNKTLRARNLNTYKNNFQNNLKLLFLYLSENIVNMIEIFICNFLI